MRKGCGRSWVRIVIGGNVNGLHRSNRSALRRSDALLQLADFGVQVRLVANGRRHAAEKSGHLRARLHESENIVDKEKHVEVLLVAEIFSDSEAGEAHAETRARRLGHLTGNQSSAAFFRLRRDDEATL